MSVKSWIKEFYPVNATSKCLQRSSDKKLIEHCLQKWEGAKEKNLKKHNVEYINGEISASNVIDNFSFVFDSDTCALCEKYRDLNTMLYEECEKCPIHKVYGHDCDEAYAASQNNPRAMIRLLKHTLKKL